MPARVAALLASRGGLCLVLGAFVLAARAWLLDAGGSPVPFWDQWDSETILYRGWASGTVPWHELFSAHNEHRIALTRLASLGLFAVNGGWDPWAQLLLNACLHAGIAALLAGIFLPALRAASRVALAGGLAIIFAATAGWQNALWGFQSQTYFTSLLAAGAIALLAAGEPGSKRAWAAVPLLVLALFSTAGGLLAVAAAAAVTLLRRRERRGWTVLPGIAAVAALGLVLHVAPPQHAALRAQDLERFLGVLARGLGWPHVESGWLWIVAQLPLVVLVTIRWRRRVPLDGAERAALGLVAFSWLNAAAIAYSRGGGLPELRPLSRYQDPLLLGAAGHLFAALRLMDLGRPGRLLALGWSAAMIAGLIALTTTNLTLNLPYKRAQDAAGLRQIRTYLATGDAAALAADPPQFALHPDPQAVQRALDDPVLRPRLPKTFFDAPDAPTPKPAVVAHGRALFIASLLVLLGTLIVAGRQGENAPAQTGRTPR